MMFLHIGGSGNPEQLAAAVGKVFAAIRATSGGKGYVPHANINTEAARALSRPRVSRRR